MEVQKAEDDLIRNETGLAEIIGRAAEFERFVHDVEVWAAGKDPWQFMPEAIEGLKSILDLGNNIFREFTENHTPHFIDRVETQTLVALATVDDRAMPGCRKLCEH